MKAFLLFLCLMPGLAWQNARAQDSSASVFCVVPLGVKGGSDESNLSAYLVSAQGSRDFICLDAGTLYAGIRRAVEKGVFTDSSDAVLKKYIHAYFISHPHLDHVAGLIMNSPEDAGKNIYGLPFCLDILKSTYFTWKGWANFADEGEAPALGKYHYVRMIPGADTEVPGTPLRVTAFPLSHGSPFQSTAFLVNLRGQYLLYLGDTGADRVEKADNLHRLWMAVAPLVMQKRLKAIFMEVSFPDEQPEKQLFGHLTPRLAMEEMEDLERLSGPGTLKGLSLVITHIKPIGGNEIKIKQQLRSQNNRSLQFIFPEQAAALRF